MEYTNFCINILTQKSNFKRYCHLKIIIRDPLLQMAKRASSKSFNVAVLHTIEAMKILFLLFYSGYWLFKWTWTGLLGLSSKCWIQHFCVRRTSTKNNFRLRNYRRKPLNRYFGQLGSDVVSCMDNLLFSHKQICNVLAFQNIIWVVQWSDEIFWDRRFYAFIAQKTYSLNF